MPIFAPHAGSTYSTEASVPNSQNRFALLGFVPNPATAGCMVWSMGSSCANASPIFPITACGTPYFAPVPFNSPCGFWAGCIVGGCAIIWLRNAS